MYRIQDIQMNNSQVSSDVIGLIGLPYEIQIRYQNITVEAYREEVD